MFQRPPFVTWPLFLRRFLHLNVGLVLFGLSVAMMVWADIGLGPWDVFHQGLSLVTPLSFGQAMIGAGLVVLLFAAVIARVKIGLASVLNMILIGVWADFFLRVADGLRIDGFLPGLLMFMAGAALTGLSTGLYITAGLGAGPRDGFVLGVVRLTGMSVRLARTIIEVAVLVSGYLMGGSVGAGTVLFALTAGPLMQFFLRLFKPMELSYDAAEARERAALSLGAKQREEDDVADARHVG